MGKRFVLTVILALFAGPALAHPPASTKPTVVRLPHDLGATWIGLPTIQWQSRISSKLGAFFPDRAAEPALAAPTPAANAPGYVPAASPGPILLTPLSPVPAATPPASEPSSHPIELLLALRTGF